MIEIGLPCIIRPSFTLGGTGGGIAYKREEFFDIVERGLDASPTAEVLIEESVLGWKEYEMEVVRDKDDNCIIVCSIENIDAMGVHTGDSITVAPALTLTDKGNRRTSTGCDRLCSTRPSRPQAVKRSWGVNDPLLWAAAPIMPRPRRGRSRPSLAHIFRTIWPSAWPADGPSALPIWFRAPACVRLARASHPSPLPLFRRMDPHGPHQAQDPRQVFGAATRTLCSGPPPRSTARLSSAPSSPSSRPPVPRLTFRALPRYVEPEERPAPSLVLGEVHHETRPGRAPIPMADHPAARPLHGPDDAGRGRHRQDVRVHVPVRGPTAAVAGHDPDHNWVAW